MSKSGVEYGELWFWGNDALLGVWMHFMAEEAAKVQPSLDWLMQFQEHWRTQAWRGADVNVALDRFVTDEQRKGIVLELIAGVARRLDRFPNAEIPVAELERIGMVTTRWGNEPLDATLVKRINRSVAKLLVGDDAPDPEAHEIKPYVREI